MKTLIILYLSLNFIGLNAMSEEKEPLTAKGIFYLDGQAISIGISGGRIVKIDRLPPGMEMPAVYVAPGLIDLQINGYMGVDFSDQNLTIKDVRNATKALWRAGVTTFFPLLLQMTSSVLKRILQSWLAH